MERAWNDSKIGASGPETKKGITVMKSILAGLVSAALLAGPIPSPAQTYNITDLGAVSGESVSAGYGLNKSGQAAGVSSSPNGDIATLFNNGKASNLGTT